MDSFDSWKQTFQNWPSTLPRSGVLVTEQETIPYGEFRVSDSMIIVDRKNPDALGARKVMVHFGDIRGLKFMEVLDLERFAALGFLPGKPASQPVKKPPAPLPKPAPPPDNLELTGNAQMIAALAAQQRD